MSILSTKRKEKQLTQKELASRIGLTREILSRYENGHIVRPNYKIIVRLSEELGVAEEIILRSVKKVGNEDNLWIRNDNESDTIFENAITEIRGDIETLRQFPWTSCSDTELQKSRERLRQLWELEQAIEGLFEENA